MSEECSPSPLPSLDEFAAEQAVGMTEFVRADWTGFGGILKHRLGDFKVYEIDLEGGRPSHRNAGGPCIGREKGQCE